MKATIESIGGVASRARLGTHEVIFDQPSSVPGGEDRGPSPLDMMVVSVAACAQYFAAAYLRARHLPTVGVAVEIDSEKERVPVSRIAHLSMRVQIPSGLDERHILGIERAIKACPEYGTLLHPPTVEIVIQPDGATTQERSTA